MDSYLALQLGNSTAKTKKAYGENQSLLESAVKFYTL